MKHQTIESYEYDRKDILALIRSDILAKHPLINADALNVRFNIVSTPGYDGPGPTPQEFQGISVTFPNTKK